MTKPATQEIAETLRDVTAAMQRAIATGHLSQKLDANDLVEILLTIADRLAPLFPEEPDAP